MIERLMCKALLELSADRAEFLSILFSRPRQNNVDLNATVNTLVDAFDSALAHIQRTQLRARSYAGCWGDLEGDRDKNGFNQKLQMKNLLIPVVGNSAGRRALRIAGEYLRSRNATGYASNVEQYLFLIGVWQDFYANVAYGVVFDSSACRPFQSRFHSRS